MTGRESVTQAQADKRVPPVNCLSGREARCTGARQTERRDIHGCRDVEINVRPQIPVPRAGHNIERRGLCCAITSGRRTARPFGNLVGDTWLKDRKVNP